MISQTAEYALRAVVHLASAPDRPHTNKEIAEATHVPDSYLSKVLQSLARYRIVRSRRGLHGGFTLVKPPSRITIYDVVNAVDPLPRIRECPLGIKSHGKRLCPLHRRLDQAIAAVEQAFKETTVAELLADPGDLTPLCPASSKRGSLLPPGR
jgi:Rrf2 family protein